MPMNYLKDHRSLLKLSLFLFVALSACKSIKPNNPPAPTLQNLPETQSRLNFPVAIPLSYLEENLNQVWGDKMFSDKGLSLGSGLFADLDVTRIGKIALRGTDQNSLKVRIPMNVKGDLKIEKRVFGQNLSTQFPFNENINPEISFIPEFGENWDLSIKNLQIDNWGRSMRYNLLGFDIDLDPLVRGQLQRVVDNQLQAAGLTRFDFKHMAEQTWQAFAEPYTIQQDGLKVHFFAIPENLYVHQEITADQQIVLYLGLEGEMHSQTGEKPLISRKPLPPVKINTSKENLVDITLPLTFAYKDLDQLMNEAIAGQRIRLDAKTVLTPSQIHAQQYGDKVLLAMDFDALRKDKNEISGVMYFAGQPIFDEVSETLKFEGVEFDVRTDNRLAGTGIKLRKRKIQRQIQKLAIIPLGGFLKVAEEELRRQAMLDTDFATFQMQDPKITVNGIYSTENALKVFIKTKGQMDVRLKEMK
ncbi:MAG: DUF4403 family protein [Cecembia sp.]